MMALLSGSMNGPYLGIQLVLIVPALVHYSLAYIILDTGGCGVTKECLFKPNNCDPNLDCTLGIIVYVAGFNKLNVQMVAHSLLPLPSLQYIAIGFSKDSKMGDDFVSECVLNPSATQSAFNDVEVYASYNHGRSNDRTYLTKEEHSILYPDGVEGGVVDGRITCQFTQQIMPQMGSKNGSLWNLNDTFYLLGATGSAQHDVSPNPVKLSTLGPRKFPLAPIYPSFHKHVREKNSTTTLDNTTVKSSSHTASGSLSFLKQSCSAMVITGVFLALTLISTRRLTQ